MDIVDAIILGIIQGLTEFLPVSSSGHLEIGREVLNADLLATENNVAVYNNVNLNYTNGFLKADKIDYDFETKYFKVSMFDEKRIKLNIIR